MDNNKSFLDTIRESKVNILEDFTIVHRLFYPVLEAPGDETEEDEEPEDEDIEEEPEEEEVEEEPEEEEVEEEPEEDEEPEEEPEAEEPETEEEPEPTEGDDGGFDNDGGTEDEFGSDDPNQTSDNPEETPQNSGKSDSEKLLTLKLIDKFISLYDTINYSIEKIMTIPKSNAYSISISSQVLENFEKLKNSIYNHILYSYRKSTYEFNLLVYNYYIEAFKVNLTFLNKIGE